MKIFLKNLFTEPNNETWCLVKVLIGMGAISFLWFSFIHVLNNHSFDPQSFGLGYGALLAGGGGAAMMKKDTSK